MSLFASLKAIFASKEKEPEAPEEMPSEEYKGFTITPAPVQEQAGYRINGTITKGEQTHSFIRADTLPTQQGCAEEMIRKAKQMIDYQGDNLF